MVTPIVLVTNALKTNSTPAASAPAARAPNWDEPFVLTDLSKSRRDHAAPIARITPLEHASTHGDRRLKPEGPS